MFGVIDYGAFIAAVILFLLVPGPGNLALLTSTRQGWVRRTGRDAGRHSGRSGLDVAGVGRGVAALLSASPAVFHGVQWLGAAYLAQFGGRMLFSRSGAAPVLDFKPYQFLRQSMMITLLNPKAIVFYMAFFPLFVDPARNEGILTFAIMAATIAVLTFAYGLTAVLLTHFLAE